VTAEQEIEPGQAKRAARIVVAKRKATESRVLANAEALAAFLRERYGMDAAVTCFGELPFSQQVSTAAQADVLVGVTGSDLISLMFLPRYGSIVEIFPAFNNENVFTPELANMARMLGKNHLSYVSLGNVTQSFDERGNQRGGKLLHSAKSVTVSIPDAAGIIRVGAQQALGGSVWGRTSCRQEPDIISCMSEEVDTFTRDATIG
jgi:hypothetical protein